MDTVYICIKLISVFLIIAVCIPRYLDEFF